MAESEYETAEAEPRIDMTGRFPSAFLILLFLSTAGLSEPKPRGDQKDTAPPQSCPVTIGQKSDIDPAEFFGSGSAHWENNLYVGALWPDGTIVFKPGEAGDIYPDGSVGMKIAWYRGNGLRGKITIQGKRLDGTAPPLRSKIGNNETGFEASEVIFPTEGCWQVTGKVADASVTFVTRVVKLPGLKPNAHD